jgi:hypothetical protein
MRLAFRWSGPILTLGSLGLGSSIVLMSARPDVNRALDPGLASLMLGSAGMLLLALPALYAAQAEATGALGLVAHALLATGLLLLVAVAALPLADATFTGAYAENAVFFLLAIALTFGLLLTGVATFRGGVFPRGAGALMLVATAGFFFAFFIAENLPPVFLVLGSGVFAVLLALGFAWVGVALWRRPAMSGSRT